jgi:hypothetical protein
MRHVVGAVITARFLLFASEKVSLRTTLANIKKHK